MGREYLVQIDIDVPETVPSEEVDELRRRERDAGMVLAESGHLVRLWRVPGRWANWGLWRAEDDEPQSLLGSLPLRPYMSITVHPTDPHPADPAPSSNVDRRRGITMPELPMSRRPRAVPYSVGRSSGADPPRSLNRDRLGIGGTDSLMLLVLHPEYSIPPRAGGIPTSWRSSPAPIFPPGMLRRHRAPTRKDVAPTL